MSEPRQQSMQIAGFLGEDRGTPEHRLALGVSPAGLNCDYRDGVLRKRAGVKRQHTSAVLGGGARVGERMEDSIEAGPFFNGALFGSWMVEFLCCPWFEGAKRQRLYVYNNTEVTDWANTPTFGVALCIEENAGNYRFRAYWCGGSVKTVTGPNITSGTVYAVGLGYDYDTSVFTLTVNGTDYTATSATMYGGHNDLHFGDGGVTALEDVAGRLWVELDEVRIWDLDAGVQGQSLQTAQRELLGSEMTAALRHYWKFSIADPEADSAGSGDLLSVPVSARGLAQGGLDAVTGIAPALNSAGTAVGALLLGTPSGLWKLESGALSYLLGVRDEAEARWVHCIFQGWTILCNGSAGNQRYKAGTGLQALSLPPPVLATEPVPTTPGGGSLSAGLYQWLFAWYDAAGVESAVGLYAPTATAASNDEALFSNLLLKFASALREVEGTVAGVRVYRTKADGSVFYFREDIAVASLSGNYVDGAADSALVTVRDPYWGYALPGKFCFVHHERLWLGVENQLVFTEVGRLGGFYSDNYISVGEDDGDVLRAAVVSLGTPLLFKTASIWQVTGSGAESYAAVKVADGVGCVSQATVAHGRGGVYFLGAQGVYRIAPGGVFPEAVAPDAHRALFESLEEGDWGSASACFDLARGLYILTLTAGGEQKTLVFPEGPLTLPSPQGEGTGGGTGGVCWEWDLAADCWFAGRVDSGAPAVYCGWRGYLCALGGATSEGAAAAGHSAFDASGTLTGSSSTTLVDSGASFPTSGHGLGNVDVTIEHANGTRETRRVVLNTGTTLHVDAAWDTTPAAGVAYWVGGLGWEWRSGRLSLDGDWHGEKVLQRVRVLQESGGTGTAQFFHAGDDLGAREYQGLSLGSRVLEWDAGDSGRGREVCVGLEEFSSEGVGAVSAMQLLWRQGKARP